MNYTNWWETFGKFDAGEDELPQMGQVISHYMKLAGMKTSALVEKLEKAGWDIGERRMEQLLSKRNISEPQSISRRRLLCQILSIPPALMGLSALSELTSNKEIKQSGKVDFAQIESVLASYWDNFYGSSIQNHASGIMLWRNHVAKIAESGSGRIQAQTLLCKFDQLVGITARDRNDFPSALYYHDESVEIAHELHNAELLTMSLFRRAKIHIQRKRIDLAYEDIKQALPYARRCRDNLKGYIFQMTAQIITLLPITPDSEIQFKRFMDEPAKILHKGNVEDDGSYVKLNQAGYQQDRARGLIRLNDIDGAMEALMVAEKLHSPNMVRWEGELAILRAQIYAQSGDVEWACHQIEEAWSLANATQSEVQRKQIKACYNDLANNNPHVHAVRQLRVAIG